MHRLAPAVLLGSSVLAGCAGGPSPLPDPGTVHRTVTTTSARAQECFDRGLALCWAFHHDEAVRSFEQALRADPGCAMALWGIGYALGPNLNFRPRDDGTWQRAWQAAQEALARTDGCRPVERALIAALAARYADPRPADRSALDLAYADAMREVHRRFPADPDVAVLFADALMNLDNRWRAWGSDEERGPHTPEIVAVLEPVVAGHPGHVGALHFWIHAVEASDRPARALAAADSLPALAPAAGHLVHMSSHIYVRLGLYDRAIAVNERAIAADDAFFAEAPRQGIYHNYRAHNHHFLVWAAMFQGSRGVASAAARQMVSKLPDDLDGQPKSLEPYLFVPMHVMMRFGMWEEMLQEPAPEERYPVARALWHHGRAVAFANTDRIDEALAEADAFEAVAATIPAGRTVRRAKVADLMAAARNMMNGEILYKRGRPDEAFAALRAGIAAEDAMPYAEPPGWMQPIRHSLGALLLDAGRVAEAEAVYRKDLERHADNVWALHGLAECLRRQGRGGEAAATEQALAEASRYADVPITASCCCRTVAAREPGP